MEQMCAGRAGRVTGFTGKEKVKGHFQHAMHTQVLSICSKQTARLGLGMNSKTYYAPFRVHT